MPPSKCEFILINGKNRGKPCNKKYCKNHQQKQVEEIIVGKIEDNDSDSEEDRENYNYEESEDDDGIRKITDNDIKKIEQHINTDFNNVLQKQCEVMGLILTDDEKNILIKSLLKLI
jgi:hypothetical protein